MVQKRTIAGISAIFAAAACLVTMRTAEAALDINGMQKPMLGGYAETIPRRPNDGTPTDQSLDINSDAVLRRDRRRDKTPNT